jgi:acyl-[acyl carrier protein]--UDP-N-acetylglucosamine O-acyltransferase
VPIFPWPNEGFAGNSTVLGGRGDIGAVICSVRIIAMYHIIHVGLNSEALEKLDALRQAYPHLYNRQDILLQLLAEAHQKFAKPVSVPKLQLVA